jgi:hypothetical protein
MGSIFKEAIFHYFGWIIWLDLKRVGWCQRESDEERKTPKCTTTTTTTNQVKFHYFWFVVFFQIFVRVNYLKKNKRLEIFYQGFDKIKFINLKILKKKKVGKSYGVKMPKWHHPLSAKKPLTRKWKSATHRIFYNRAGNNKPTYRDN